MHFFLDLYQIGIFEIFIGIVVIGIISWWLTREKNLPPGPIGLPMVGCLPFLGSEAYKTLHNWSQKYGPIYSLYLGRKLAVVLGDFEVVKEALSNNNILDRPKNPPNHLLPKSTNFSVSNGDKWKEQRKFSIQLLRQLGMAKQEMEDQIQNEIQKLCSEIDKKRGEPVNLDGLLYSSVSNNMLNMLIGKPLDYDDKDRIFLNRMLQTMTVFFRPTRVHAYFPWLKWWMTKLKIWGYDQAGYFMEKFAKFIQNQIDSHKKTLDQDITRDYIDGYLKTMSSYPASYIESSFSEKMLKGNFQSLFSAGSTPSRAALEWSILSMILYPEVQAAVHKELDSVLGREKPPSWSDHKNLPYTLAVIYESMRQNTIVPISMLRCTSKRTKISKYDIPEKTIIMTNIWGVHHDPASWDDPYNFKPERFIQDGKSFRPPEFIPFSYGKRNCPGEDMAIMTVFLYFASLMQRYSISLYSKDDEVKQVLGVARLVILDNIKLTIRS